MEKEFGYSDAAVELGKNSHTPPISYVKAFDIDQKVIKLVYTNHMITVKELLHNYWQSTSHRAAFQSQPCLRVLTGKKSKSIAEDKQCLYSLGLNLNDDICFRVEDKDHPLEIAPDIELEINKKIGDQGDSKEDMVELTFSFASKKIQHKVAKGTKIIKVKQSVINIFGKLKKEKPDHIFFKCNETFLDNDKTIADYKLDDQIKIFAKGIECSYKGTTQVLLPSLKYIPISELKPGQKIMTLNRTSFELESTIISQVSQTILTQSVIIKFKSGRQLQTTPNHLLLCQDGVFRMIKSDDVKELCLQEGHRLKLSDDKIDEVVTIQVRLIPHQIFYSIIPDKNKNIVVSKGIVSHHHYIRVKAPDGVIMAVDTAPSDSFADIKKKLQIGFNLDAQYLHLIYCMKKLKDQETMLDKISANRATVNLKVLEYKPQHALVHPDSTISVSENGIIMESLAKESVKGTVLMTTDHKHQSLKEGLSVNTSQVVQKGCHISFVLDQKDNRVLKLSEKTTLILHDGTIIQAGSFYEKYKDCLPRFLPTLKSTNKQGFVCIQQLSLVNEKTQFLSMQTDSHNYIVNSVIIPNHLFNFIAILKSAKKIKIPLNIPKTTTVEEVKQIISPMIEIPVQLQSFTFNNDMLQNNETLVDRHIEGHHVIIVRQNDDKVYRSSIIESLSFKEEDMQSKKVTFQLDSGKKCTLEYSLFKTWVLKDFLKQYMNTDDPAYFALFADIILFSNELLGKLQCSDSFKQPNCTVLILKNEKLSFISMLDIHSEQLISSSCIMFGNLQQTKQIPTKSPIKVNTTQALSSIFQNAEKIIKSKDQKDILKTQHFYQPFLYFTCRHYHQQIYSHIKQFDRYREEAHKVDSVYAIIKDLYCNMNMLTNYLKVCYYGMRNFRAGTFLKPGSSFFFHNFTLAYPFKLKDKVAKEVSQNLGTLFHIQSTSGKVISVFAIDPTKQEILFAPYTSFLVEKVQIGQLMDEVWLTEISAPISFKKNIILWVDDNPHYNQQQYDIILNIRPQIQILQLTSTTAAERWIKQFGWILTWKGLDFKLISDMARLQWKGKQMVENKEAGVDLLQLLYITKGYSAKTLIFTGNEARAKQIAKRRQIPQQRYVITEREGELMAYVGIKDY